MESEQEILLKLKECTEMCRKLAPAAESICDSNLEIPGYMNQLFMGYKCYKDNIKYETFPEMENNIYYFTLMQIYQEKLINNYSYQSLDLMGSIGHVLSGDLPGYKEYGNYKLLGKASWEV